MTISELAALPVRAGAALRDKRFFHPAGVLCAGSVRRVAVAGDGLPIVSGDIVGRISKGAGTPGSLPDFAGLAWRMGGDADGAQPWDVLTVSSAVRAALRPVAGWQSAPYSTLMPLGYRGGVYWLRAQLTTPLPNRLSLAVIRDQLSSGPIEFTVAQARGTSGFTDLATVTFDREMGGDEPGCDERFDPTVRSGTDVSLLPTWLTAFRRSAYRNSRKGRGAE